MCIVRVCHCWQLETSIYISTTTVSHLVSDALQQCDSPTVRSQKAPMGMAGVLETISYKKAPFSFRIG